MNPLKMHIIPKLYTMDGGRGMHLKEMGVIAWGLEQPYKIKTSWSPVGS